MTCLSIVRLTPRSVSGVLEGTVRLEGDDLLTKSEREMQRIRGRKVAMILQDPMSSLNPVFSIGMQVREPVAAYHGLRGGALRRRAADLARLPAGCAFAARCPRVMDRCAEAPPELEVAPGHTSRCWLQAPA